jgi:hypothetical protein
MGYLTMKLPNAISEPVMNARKFLGINILLILGPFVRGIGISPTVALLHQNAVWPPGVAGTAWNKKTAYFGF